jgi:hypothetical protein
LESNHRLLHRQEFFPLKCDPFQQAVHKIQSFASEFLCQQDVTNQDRRSTLTLPHFAL